jgi:hypothetical protein
MPPVTPALDQSIARLGARILDHPWAWPETDIAENNNKESRNGLMLPGGGRVIFERTNLELLRVLGAISSENEKFMLVCTLCLVPASLPGDATAASSHEASRNYASLTSRLCPTLVA